MKIYVMRHGTTCWNEREITQGRTNNRLSKNGIELTKQVASNLKDKKIDTIFCSPLMRTIQTANLINVYHKAKIVKDERLIEVEQGIFTGRHKDSLSQKERELKLIRSKECGMESFEELAKRTQEFVDYMRKKCQNQNVLIITHNCNASVLEMIFQNKDIDFNNTKSFRTFKNAEIKVFEI